MMSMGSVSMEASSFSNETFLDLGVVGVLFAMFLFVMEERQHVNAGLTVAAMLM